MGARQGRGFGRAAGRGGGARGRRDHDARPRPGGAGGVRGRRRSSARARQDAPLRSRVQHPLPRDRASGRGGRRDDRPQISRTPGAQRVPGGSGRAGARRGAPGRERQCLGRCARVCGGDRLRSRGRVRDDVPRGDGDRSVRRADGAVRRVTALVQAGFETLTAAGYAPEIAYFECMHELKLIVDLMYRGGMKFMRYSISDTAEYGDYTRGPKVVTPEVRAAMERILADIQSGSFAREWIAESRSGGRKFEALRRAGAEHPIEQVGAKLRAMMPWTEEGKGARDSGLGTRGSSPVSEPRAPKPEPL